MSKLDDIIRKPETMRLLERNGVAIAFDINTTIKQEIKALMLELIGEDIPAHEDYGGGGRSFQKKLIQKVNEL